ncbi:RNA polymerase sigma factor [Coprobacter tertius]|uniref:Sigma-70 family RNA polymerase sigma factor n=1 Tax=Coprobacter tertius TaxID=2944915 RepID=A0ABT1MIU5_9BACT|nr:sigma-70 family RNA polymerase sigma factor [Coprobacter tertius]MCP9611151.1 sigma-70 family RNA polymerase sigma factor [Coprobacter tertius]
MENFNLCNELVKIQTRLFLKALYITRNPERAKDLLQETNLKILNNVDSYKYDENFIGWCFSVMKNVHNDILRKEKRIFTVPLDESLDAGYCMHFGSEIDMEILNKELSSLSEEDRLLLTFRIMKMKYKDIAKKLGIPVGTVKSRMFYLKTKLNYVKEWFE